MKELLNLINVFNETRGFKLWEESNVLNDFYRRVCELAGVTDDRCSNSVVQHGDSHFFGPLECIYISVSNNAAGEPVENTDVVNGLWISKYPVTSQQFEQIMGYNASGYNGDELPVQLVSWFEAIEFCEAFAEEYDVPARLPTEEEWEYAYRAGNDTLFWWGDEFKSANAWYMKNANSMNSSLGDVSHGPRRVGLVEPNDWGIGDMAGNVWEWCADAVNRDGEPDDNGEYRICKGGSWGSLAESLSASARLVRPARYRTTIIGFRVVF